jgi:hypothetical protein
MKTDRSRVKKALLVAGLLAVVAYGVSRSRKQEELPSFPFVRQAVLVNGLGGLSGKYCDTIQFSPDSEAVAYLWRKGLHGPPLPSDIRPHPRTLEESIYVRWFEVSNPSLEKSVLLEFIELDRPGESHFHLEARVYFSPDSSRLAAISPGNIMVVERDSASFLKIESHKGERFGEVLWSSPQALRYSTYDGSHLTFWEVDLDRPNEPRSLYREYQPGVATYSPEDLLSHDISPRGRYVVMGETIVDLDTGEKRNYGRLLSHYRSWEPEGKHLLIQDAWANDSKIAGVPTGSRTFLIDPATGEVTELTTQIQAELGKRAGMTPPSIFNSCGSSAWTPDGRHIILGETEPFQSFLLKVDPIEKVFSTKGRLKTTPIPNRLMVTGGGRGEWIDFDGNLLGPIPGNPTRWIWAPNGLRAAEMRGPNVEVFDVPQIHTQNVPVH